MSVKVTWHINLVEAFGGLRETSNFGAALREKRAALFLFLEKCNGFFFKIVTKNADQICVKQQRRAQRLI